MNGINHNNNYPFIYFDTLEDKYEFIRCLKSVPREQTESSHFVINNPQLLPDDIRELHMHENTNMTDEFDPPQQGDDLHLPSFKTPPLRAIMSNEDSAQLKADCASSIRKGVMLDNIYLVEKNINLLRNCSIDNNTLEKTGLIEYLSFPHMIPPPPPPDAVV